MLQWEVALRRRVGFPSFTPFVAKWYFVGSTVVAGVQRRGCGGSLMADGGYQRS